MKFLEMLTELETALNKYTAANMIGKDFDCEEARDVCEKLKREDPEKFSCFVTEGTDHELMVSVSDFFGKLLNM